MLVGSRVDDPTFISLVDFEKVVRDGVADVGTSAVLVELLIASNFVAFFYGLNSETEARALFPEDDVEEPL
ncbi:hypothetical protein Tco_1333882 [Tanacetum coccineum]